MSWTPAALATALHYEHVFQPLECFIPGVEIPDQHSPTLEQACAWLDSYNHRNPDSEIQIVDVSELDGELCVSVFSYVEIVDLKMV